MYICIYVCVCMYMYARESRCVCGSRGTCPVASRQSSGITGLVVESSRSNWMAAAASARLLGGKGVSLSLAFTRYCHHQYCMVYGINREGRWRGV